MARVAHLARAGSILRRTCLTIWLATLAAGLIAYLAAPHLFTADNIAAILRRFERHIWLIYIAMSMLRGFTLLPSTPLVLAGTLLFPDRALAVFAVSLAGIAVSSATIYFLSEHLGFADHFEAHKPDMTAWVRQRLEHPFGLVFVAAWAFFPLVPTDLVCYVAGSARIKFVRFISAVLAGEAVLCWTYIFAGGWAWRALG